MTSSMVRLWVCIKNSMMEGSTAPERVPMGTPSRGVKPMDVSMDLPPSMAQMEEPLPR